MDSAIRACERMKMLFGRAARGALVVSVLAGALLPARAAGAAREDISLALKDKVITDLSSSGLVLSFRIAVTNRAAADLALVRYHYRFVVNSLEYLNLTVRLDNPISVPAGQDTLIALPVKISYALLVAAIGPVESRALCDIMGEMDFADEKGREDKVTFAFPGEFPIFKDTEIAFRPLAVSELSLGGADVVFRPSFRNLNPYELVVDRIRFRLYFGEREVLTGDIAGDKSLPAGGEKSFDLALLIDFFEAGQTMRGLFDKPPILCRFTGEIEIDSAWGKLVARFDKTESVPLEKKT
jgi:hypothetical protein